MDIPNRTPQGQTVQENSEVLGSDTAPTYAPTGPKLEMQLVEGKAGSVEKLGAVQTDHTDLHTGPAPLYEGPGKKTDGQTN